MKTRYVLILFFFSFFKLAFSNTDSLANFIQTSQDVSLRFDAINQLISKELNGSPEKAEKYALLQLQIVEVDTQVARAYLNIGLALDYQSKFDSAITFYNKSLVLNKEIESDFWQAQVLLNLGIVNFYKGDYDASVQHYFNALKKFEKINDKARMSAIYNNLGSIYRSKNELLKAIIYHRKSLVIDLELGNDEGVAASYNNIGIAYRKLNKLDSSLYFHEQSLAIKREINDENGIASSLTNIGQVYFHKKEYEKSLKYSIEALALERKLNDKRGICQSYVNIGEGYLKIGDLNSASFYLERGYEMAKEIGVIEDLISALEGLAAIHAEKGEYKKALGYYQDYSKYKDSLLNEETNRQIAELDAIYENESKRKEIALLNKEKTLQQVDIENQRLQKIVMGVALLSVLVILFFIFRGSQQKKKVNKLLATQKGIVEEKNKEITDSINYAQRIQKAVLKSEERELSNFPDHFILFKPKDIVSGDFYWLIEKNENIYIAVADCTGHGVPGGFMSMLGVAFLNEITAHKELLSPAEILNQLRSKIIKELGQKGALGESRDGMDISMLKIDKFGKTIEWSGANNPLWIMSTNEKVIGSDDGSLPIEKSFHHFCEIKANKQPIGYHVNQEPFTNHKMMLNKDDLLYLITDGYVDQFGGEKGKKFMKKRFKQLLMNNIDIPIDNQKEALDTYFNQWKGNIDQLDDVCVIGIKI